MFFADVEVSAEMGGDGGPVVIDGALAFDVGKDAAALPVGDGADGFPEAAREFAFGDEAFRGRVSERGADRSVCLTAGVDGLRAERSVRGPGIRSVCLMRICRVRFSRSFGGVVHRLRQPRQRLRRRY